MHIRSALAGWLALGWSLAALAVEAPVQPIQELSQQLSQQAKDMFPAPLPPTNRPAWKGAFAVGMTLTRGNSDTLLVTSKVEAERRSAANELMLGLDGAYGEDKAVKNNETLHGYGQGDHFFTRQLFGFLRLDGLHDGIKDIKYRYTVSPGAGYYLVRATNLTFAVEAGPSMVVERQDDTMSTYAAFRTAERVEYKLNPNTRLWHGAEFIPEEDRLDNFVVNAEAGIETDITKCLGLQVFVQDNYVNRPAPGFKYNDLRLVSGVAYKF
jgi:putative salt-induced outer membrane protein YdiY